MRGVVRSALMTAETSAARVELAGRLDDSGVVLRLKERRALLAERHERRGRHPLSTILFTSAHFGSDDLVIELPPIRPAAANSPANLHGQVNRALPRLVRQIFIFRPSEKSAILALP